MDSSGKAPASAEMGAAYFATHRVCSTNLCASQRKKQYAGIHDLLYVGVLPDNLDIAAAALMPLLGLQTAMISQFSTGGESFRRMMNAITGGGVWFSVILIAVTMLLHSRKLKEVKSVDPLGE